jgi:hypothetical protein
MTEKEILKLLFEIPEIPEFIAGNSVFQIQSVFMESLIKFGLNDESIKNQINKNRKKIEHRKEEFLDFLSPYLEKIKEEVEILKDKYEKKSTIYQNFRFDFDLIEDYVNINYPKFKEQLNYYFYIGKFYAEYNQELKSILSEYLNSISSEPGFVNYLNGFLFALKIDDEENQYNSIENMFKMIPQPKMPFYVRIKYMIDYCHYAILMEIEPNNPAKTQLLKPIKIQHIKLTDFTFIINELTGMGVILQGQRNDICKHFILDGEKIKPDTVKSYSKQQSENQPMEPSVTVAPSIKDIMKNFKAYINNLKKLKK